jgi:hypothetical protein
MNRIFRISAIVFALVLIFSCVAYAADDVFVNDEPSDNSVLNDNTDISQGITTAPAATLQETLDSIKAEPNNPDYYKTAAQLYANSSNTGFKVFTDGNPIDFSKYDNVLPVIDSGRTLIPIRALAEGLGATVDYNSSLRLITITLEDKVIKLTLDSNAADVNGTQKTLDVPAKSVSGRTMVPIRFVGEAFGKTVGYDASGEIKVISVY